MLKAKKVIKMKAKRLLSKVKYNAYKLKEGGQIPSSLFKAICNLDDKSDEEEVKFLMDLTYSSTRIKGFYFKFPEGALEVDKLLKGYYETRKGK